MLQKTISIKIACLIAVLMGACLHADNGTGYKIKPLDAKNIFQSNTPKNKNFTDGNRRTAKLADKLKGSEFKIRLLKPQYIDRLAIVPGIYPNWSYPKEIELVINSRDKIKLSLDKPKGDVAEIVTARIDKKVSSIRIKVLDTYSKGVMPWGGFSVIGEAFIAPIKYSLANEPLDSTNTELIFEIEAENDVKAPAQVLVGPGLYYDHPALDIKKGRGVYAVVFDKLTPSKDYGFEYGPQQIREVTIGFDDFRDNGLKLISVKRKSSGEKPEHWFDLTPIKKETKKVGDKVWTKSQISEGAGRFANSTYNGLLMDTVSDYVFKSNTAGPADYLRRQNFNFFVKGLERKENPRPGLPWNLKVSGGKNGETIDVNWTCMTRTRPLAGGGSLKMICGVLAPGFIFESAEDIVINSSGGRIPHRSGAPNEDERRFLVNKADPSSSGPGVVITSDGNVYHKPGKIKFEKLSQPWVIAVWGGLKSSTFRSDEAIGLLITADKGILRWNEKGIRIPKGTVGFSTAFHGLLKKNWKPLALKARANLLMKLLRAYPISCDEWYRIENGNVEIRNEFTYYRWGPKKWQMKDYAPLPPVMSWGQKSVGWPNMPKTTSPTIHTPVGPYKWVKGNTVEYSIPIFPVKYAAFPCNDRFKDAQEKLSQKVLDLPEPTAKDWNDHPDAWLAIYAPLHWPSALIGGSVMNEKARERLLTVGKKTLARGVSNYSWYKRKEMFTGREYVASCWPDTSISPAMFGDTSSCVGAALYSLYLYAKYSGDWDLVREYWPRVMDIIRYAEVINDWATPATSARESVLFSGIDMDTIGFAGLAAAQKMAEFLGYEEDNERLTYLRAKQYTTAALRMNFQKYLDPKGRNKRMWVNGFSEDGPCYDMANPHDGIALDHVGMVLCWQGQEPENYMFLRDCMPGDFHKDFQKNFMDRYFSSPDGKVGWRGMGFNQDRAAAHIAARAWAKEWPDADLLKESEDFIKYYPPGMSPFNAGMWAAVWGHKDGIYLMDWEPAKLGDMYYDSKTKILEINVECDKPFTIRLHSPEIIKGFSARLPRGQKVKITKESENVYLIKMPEYSGKIKVKF